MRGITIRKQEGFMWTEINIVLENNGGYMLSSLGGRLIIGTGSKMKIFAIRQLQFSEF